MEHARTSKSSMAQRHHGGRACPPGGSAVRRAPGQDGRGGASDDRGPSRMSRDDRRRAPVHVDLECTRHPRAFNDKLLRGESRLASRWRPSPKKKLAQARYVSGEKGDTRVFAAFEERKTRFAWPCLSSATAAPLRCTFTLDREAIASVVLANVDIRRLRLDPQVAMDIAFAAAGGGHGMTQSRPSLTTWSRHSMAPLPWWSSGRTPRRSADLEASLRRGNRAVAAQNMPSSTVRQNWVEPLGKTPPPSTGWPPITFRRVQGR